ncbi:benzoate 4-monooxygenase cytochrome P450 [Hypoxylon crocopeplum]|nr:benzoate 4-monooxygenase cytochrome P450 [Hypoxylon crocopeplum]
MSEFLDISSLPVLLRGGFGSSTYVVLTSVVLGLGLIKALYDHISHPLYRFPGPFSASISNALHSWTFMAGRQPYDVLKLHEMYGPVVRTSPNELSFNSAQSWRDIYGFRPNHKTFVKSPFYDGGSFADVAHSIVSERDPTNHGIMRKYLSHAFSDRSLKEQEGLVGEIGPGKAGLDIIMWFNLLTLDIIGSLAFGKPFGGLESAQFHPWIKLVTGAMSQGALADCMSRFPMVAAVFKWLMPGTIDKLIEDTRAHEAHTIDLVDQRLKNITDRPDFLTRMLENREKDDISDVQIAAHASDFVTAGSETTATAPLPFALPRVVPEGGDTVDGHFLPGGMTVSTAPLAASNSSSNFEKPFEFIPERWMGENARDVLDASQPFSLGPRGCLGRNLAWMEMNTTLSKLHFKYDLELLSTELDWHRDSRMHTLWHKPEMMVRVHARSTA